MENNDTKRASAAAIDAYLDIVKKLASLNQELYQVRKALEVIEEPTFSHSVMATGASHYIWRYLPGVSRDIAVNMAACNRELKRMKK